MTDFDEKVPYTIYITQRTTRQLWTGETEAKRKSMVSYSSLYFLFLIQMYPTSPSSVDSLNFLHDRVDRLHMKTHRTDDQVGLTFASILAETPICALKGGPQYCRGSLAICT
jgi:hypothetical protein